MLSYFRMLNHEGMHEEKHIELGVQSDISAMIEIMQNFVKMIFYEGFRSGVSYPIDHFYENILNLLNEKNHLKIFNATLGDLFPRAAKKVGMHKIKFCKMISIFWDHAGNCPECRGWINRQFKNDIHTQIELNVIQSEKRAEIEDIIKSAKDIFDENPQYYENMVKFQTEEEKTAKECEAMMPILILYYHNGRNTHKKLESFIKKLHILKCIED